MRKLYFFIFISCFLSACITHELENPFAPPAEQQEIPPGSGTWQKTIDPRDGHYNVKIENTKTTYQDAPLENYSPVYADVDFRSFDHKSGVLMFGYDGIFCWVDLPIEIDSEGKFETTLGPQPQFFLTSYIGCKLQITGKIINDELEARATETLYAGTEPDKLKPLVVKEYTLAGYKRYKPKTTPARTIEGEYKSITTAFGNTCAWQNLPSENYYFIIRNIPQDQGLYNINIEDLLPLPGVPIAPDGRIDGALQNGNDKYILKGIFTPEQITLSVSLVFGDLNCVQEYEMRGEKRFEETDGKDATVDGIYSALVDMQDNTCDDTTYRKRRHLDVRTINGQKFLLKVGLLEFSPTADSAGNFLETYTDDRAGEIYTIKGNVTPEKLNAQLSVTERYYHCYYLYRIEGKKLYKNN